MTKIRARRKANKIVDHVNRYCDELSRRIERKYPNHTPIQLLQIIKEEVQEHHDYLMETLFR